MSGATVGAARDWRRRPGRGSAATSPSWTGCPATSGGGFAPTFSLHFLTPLFAPLPEAVLAALIIHARWRLVASPRLSKLRRAAPVEVWFGVITLWGVLHVDVPEGMIIGLLASLLFGAYRSSRARISSLGRVPGVPGAYSDLARHPDDVPIPGVLIVYLDTPQREAGLEVYFAEVRTSAR